MNKKELLQQVEVIFKDILENKDVILDETTTANDVEGWDSLTHIQLIVAIEKHFKIKFSSKENLSWKDFGEMLEGISSKLR